MPHLTVPEDTFKRLAAKAAALNFSVDDLVKAALDQLAETGTSASESEPLLTGNAWHAELSAWRRDAESRDGRYPRGFVLDDSPMPSTGSEKTPSLDTPRHQHPTALRVADPAFAKVDAAINALHMRRFLLRSPVRVRSCWAFSSGAGICGKLFTMAQTKVRRVISSLSPAVMTRINACLKAGLELP